MSPQALIDAHSSWSLNAAGSSRSGEPTRVDNSPTTVTLPTLCAFLLCRNTVTVGPIWLCARLRLLRAVDIHHVCPDVRHGRTLSAKRRRFLSRPPAPGRWGFDRVPSARPLCEVSGRQRHQLSASPFLRRLSRTFVPTHNGVVDLRTT